MAARTCTLVRRDLAGPDGRREGVSTADGEELAGVVQELLEDAQSDLRWDAVAAVESNIVDVSSFYELKVRQGADRYDPLWLFWLLFLWEVDIGLFCLHSMRCGQGMGGSG